MLWPWAGLLSNAGTVTVGISILRVPPNSLPLALRDEVCSELGGGLGLVALAEGVRRGGAGLEVDGLLQQAGDALHFELDGGGGDAPVVFAAHDVHLSHVGCRKAMLLGTHYWSGSRVQLLYCYCAGGCLEITSR